MRVPKSLKSLSTHPFRCKRALLWRRLRAATFACRLGCRWVVTRRATPPLAGRVLGRAICARATGPQKFHPSAGQLTGVPLQTLWVTNGDRHMVVLRVDLIAAFDGLVFEIERRLSSILGEDLSGQVAMVTSHSHSSPAAHHQSLQSRSGLTAMTRASLSASWIRRSIRRCAHSRLAPAQLGVGLMPNADPKDVDELWRDRRTENDDLVDIDGQPTGPGYKDPSAQILRVDSADGELLAVLLNVGLHGTNFDDDNCWSHRGAPGAVAYGLSARLAGVPVFLLQGAGGDTSPSGRGATAMTKVDDLAQRAGARLAPLVEATQTSGETHCAGSRTPEHGAEPSSVSRGAPRDHRVSLRTGNAR